jgi:hypothetical protein
MSAVAPTEPPVVAVPIVFDSPPDYGIHFGWFLTFVRLQGFGNTELMLRSR